MNNIICEIIDVEEPDFGCEGRPEGEIYAHITVKDNSGERVIAVPEGLLYRSRCDEGMVLIRRGEGYFLAGREKDFPADMELVGLLCKGAGL